MARYKQELVETTAINAIETFYSDIEGLAEEAREVFDNASEGLQQTSRLQTFEETAGTLEDIQDPGAPDAEIDPKCIVSISIRGGKKRGNESRATRLSNAVSYGQAGVEALRTWVEEQEAECDEGEEAVKENPEELGEEELADITKELEERRELLQALGEYLDEVEEHIGNAEGCEFPGMYG